MLINYDHYFMIHQIIVSKICSLVFIKSKHNTIKKINKLDVKLYIYLEIKYLNTNYTF